MADLPPAPPRRGLDPLAATILGIALALLAGLLLYLLLRTPEQAPEPKARGEGVQRDLQAQAEALAQKLLRQFEPQKPIIIKPEPIVKPPPRPATKPALGTHPLLPLPDDTRWRYKVTLEPPVWRDAELLYTTKTTPSGTAVRMEFLHANGKNSWDIGIFAPRQRSHAQLRFPGFFMHAANLALPMKLGDRFEWDYPWQMPDNSIKEGRTRLIEAIVAAHEKVKVPAGTFEATRMELGWKYMDDRRVLHHARETIWYSFEVKQLVKVVREGKTPDEQAHRIVAELVEFK